MSIERIIAMEGLDNGNWPCRDNIHIKHDIDEGSSKYYSIIYNDNESTRSVINS